MALEFLTDGEMTVIRMSGQLTCEDQQGLVARFSAWVERRQKPRCILDLEALQMLDSTGIGAIVSCLHKVRVREGDMALAGALGRIDTVLKIARVDQIIPMFATAEAVRQAWASRRQ